MLQNFLGTCGEVIGQLEALVVRDEYILHDNVSVLDGPERHFSLNLASGQALCTLAQQEALDFTTIGLIARPACNVIRKSGITNPSLATIQKIASLSLPCCRLDR